ncbi:MAG: DNA-binding protein HU [Burkholderia sp.]|jgi:DNA-binding protein HU-beta
MNKNDLVERVAMRADISKGKAAKAVDAVLAEIGASLKKGEDVTLVGFGTFTVAERAARLARNPQTGATVSVPAQTVPKFRPGKALKDSLQKD